MQPLNPTACGGVADRLLTAVSMHRLAPADESHPLTLLKTRDALLHPPQQAGVDASPRGQTGVLKKVGI